MVKVNVDVSHREAVPAVGLPAYGADGASAAAGCVAIDVHGAAAALLDRRQGRHFCIVSAIHVSRIILLNIVLHILN